MTVMLLQRFSSPHTSQSQKPTEGLTLTLTTSTAAPATVIATTGASTSVTGPSTGGTAATAPLAGPIGSQSTSSNNQYGNSASPTSIASLSTPSPTPLPFLFLLESQESWEDQDSPIGNNDNCPRILPLPLPTPPAPSSSSTSGTASTSEYPIRYTRFPAKRRDSFIIDDHNHHHHQQQNHNQDHAISPSGIYENNNLESEFDNKSITVRNNNNNTRRSSNRTCRLGTTTTSNNINNNNNNINNNNNNNTNNNNSVIILRDFGVDFECKNRRRSVDRYCRRKSEIEGWIIGNSGADCLGIGVGNQGIVGQDCTAGISGAAGTGSGGGGSGSGDGGIGTGNSGIGGSYGRSGQSSGGYLPSGVGIDPRFSASGIGSAAAGNAAGNPGGGPLLISGSSAAAAASAAAASNASNCNPVAGLTRLESQGVAMRYYRLWIYACNIVLLMSALGFAAAVGRTLVFSGDPRRHLVPGVPRLLDSTALYAYLALATQLGLVQLLGCIAARRLSAKLLNAYWMLLLALLFGDAVIGVAWVFKYDRMRAELRPSLRLRLQLEYGKDSRFSEHWDRLQRDFSCCGVSGQEDFELTSLGDRLPQSCCPPYSITATFNGSETCQQTFTRGCEDALADWLKKTADLLFVLGICVIAFAKLCFLGILRYEIREMIQKIRLLREPPMPPPSAILGGSTSVLCTSPPFVQSFSQLGVSPVVDTILTNNAATHLNHNNNNSNHNNNNTNNNNMINNNNNTSNNNNNAGAGAGPRRTTLPMASLTSGNSSMLQQSDDYSGVRHPLLSSNLQDGGADSDTNSHCALILEETTPPSISAHSGCTAGTRHGDKGNGNNNYEMREFNRRLLMSNGAATGNFSSGPRNRRT